MATPSADDQQRVYAIVRKLYGPAATFQVFPRRVVLRAPEGETGELVSILDITHPDALYMAEAALREQIERQQAGVELKLYRVEVAHNTVVVAMNEKKAIEAVRRLLFQGRINAEHPYGTVCAIPIQRVEELPPGWGLDGTPHTPPEQPLFTIGDYLEKLHAEQEREK